MGDRVRVYFAARNTAGKSYPAYLDIAYDDPLRVLAIQEAPLFAHGPIGTFDDDGIMPACALHYADKVWMYYSGWNRRVSIPYHNTTGIAVSHDAGVSFSRMFDGPILERNAAEPYMAVTPWVVNEFGSWKMWYVSGLTWQQVREKLEPVYGIMFASSINGIEWKRTGTLAIPQMHAQEACAHPTVVFRDGLYHMWFCHRHTIDFRDGVGSYRIGYAQSEDGVNWGRLDSEAGIAVADSGWDSTMLCYPSVIEWRDTLLMLYNGNGFGQSGIGCAVWEGELPCLGTIG